MSKYQRLTKRIVKTAIIAMMVIGGFGAVYGVLSYFSDEVEQEKTSKAGKYDQDTALLTTLRNQLEKSGEAQKRYVALQADRAGEDFAGSMEAMKEFLRNSKSHYRFDKVNFKPQKDVPADKPELANFNYNVLLQPHMSVQMLAASDTHVFSFIDDLRRSAPGLIRIDAVRMKRISDMTDVSIGQIPSGVTPLLVDATVEFTWIHLTPKDIKDPKNAANPPAPPH